MIGATGISNGADAMGYAAKALTDIKVAAQAADSTPLNALFGSVVESLDKGLPALRAVPSDDTRVLLSSLSEAQEAARGFLTMDFTTARVSFSAMAEYAQGWSADALRAQTLIAAQAAKVA